MEYNIDYKLIGIRIKNYRLKLKLTQEALAEAVGISIQHLSKIENGNTKLSLPCIVAVANALNTTTDHLLVDNVKDSKTYLLKDVETIFSDCTPEESFVLIETAKTMKESIRIKGMSNKKTVKNVI